MSALGELSVPEDGTEFDDLDALVRALDDWAVKTKFSFRTAERDSTRGRWICAELESSGCRWQCRAFLNNDEAWQLVITEGEHSCIGRGVRSFGSSSKKEWLDLVVARHINITKVTRPKEIVDLLRIRFAEEISYKIAQLCRLRLLDGDIGRQRHSFQLLPAYKFLLESRSPGVHVDLVRDRHSMHPFSFFYFFIPLY